MAAAGLSDRVYIDLCDYRDVDGQYDAVISVEMIEAVGYSFWPTYFRKLDRLVRPGGRVAIQAITMPHERMLASRNTHTWIQKYIFPGGMLPSTQAISAITEREHEITHYRHGVAAAALCRDAAAVARALRRPARRRVAPWVSIQSSSGCGSCTWPTRRRDSAPDILMCTSGRSHRRRPMVNASAVSGASLFAIIVVHATTFVIGRRIGRYNVVDIAWGVGFVAVAAAAAAVGSGDVVRRVLLVVLTAVWGLRLAWHMQVKTKGKGEDPRYEHLLKGDFSAGTVIRKIFLIQAAATWFISLPVQLSAVLGRTPTILVPVLVVGVAVWAIGVFFEAVGDHQLRTFKADPANKGKIMDRGLWSWTRHPNYFGDAAVWWGMWLVSIAAWVSLTTVLSPVLMTYFLVYATGARLTEKYMRDRPGFSEYCSRTSFFVPWPPRERSG